MKESILRFLACPRCGGGFELRAGERRDEEILDGELVCTGRCSLRYPIVRGIPRLQGELGIQQETSEHFGFQWTKHLEGGFERDSVYGTGQEEWLELAEKFLRMPLADLKGQRVLDAGCGSGKLGKAFAPYGPEVVSMDIHAGIEHVYREIGHLPGMHVIQGDILNPPLADGAFDLVWSTGVIHHTPDPYRCFEQLSSRVAEGGRFYLWVYRERSNPYRMIRDVLRVGHRIPPRVLYALSYAMAVPLYPVFNAWYLFARLTGRESLGGLTQYKNRRRELREIALNLFDNITPRYHFRYTEDEVRSWFERFGFRDLYSSDPVDVGLCGIKDGNAASRSSKS